MPTTFDHPLTLEDPAAGEHFTFLASARTAGDGRFRFRWTLAPGKRGPGEHVHPTETETFAIVSGTLRIWLDGVAHELGPGQRLAVGPGVRHRFLNPGGEPVVVDVDLDGTRMEDQLVPVSVLFAAGRRAGRTRPGARELLRMVVHIRHVDATRFGSRVAQALFVGAAALLRGLGVRPLAPVTGWATGTSAAPPAPSSRATPAPR